MTKVTSEGLEVLVVGVKWPPETFIQRKLEGLAKEGFEVTVATAVPRAKGKKTLAGITLVRLSHSDDFPLTSLFRLLRDAFMLAVTAPDRVLPTLRAIRAQAATSPKAIFARMRAYLPLARLHPDVVHFEWNSAATDYAPLVQIWACPTVVSCRGGQINVRPHVPGNEAFVAGLRESFGKADAVHCVSSDIRDEAESYGLDRFKAVVIPPCVDPDFFKPAEHKTRDGLFRIVTVGTMNWRKGYEFGLVALRKLTDQGVPSHLEIIGDGPERQRILYTIHDLNLEDHVSLPGRLSPEQIRGRLQGADVFLLSSHSEGISNAVLEAMSCGLPVVTTRCGGMGEAVTDGIEGFVVPVRDSGAMSVALKALALDPDLRARMGVAARHTIVSKFSLSWQIQQFSSLYSKLAQREQVA